MSLLPITRLTERAWHTPATQMTARTATHRSSPTDRPVDAPHAIGRDCASRQPSRHTFDIRV